MTLKNFEEHIEDKILQRGHDYYLSGFVSSLEYDGDGWIAEVDGSEVYTVCVNLSSSGEILEADCDCPYDWGPFCKHQAAVFYALREMSSADRLAKIEGKTPKETLDSVLRQLDKETLLSILLDYAKDDRRMADMLMLRFSKEKASLKYAKSVIKASIKSAMHRGFVDYAHTMDAAEGAYEVLRMAEDADNDVLTRTSLCILVLEEMIRLQEDCDDSDGAIGGVICGAIDLISSITEDLPQFHPDAEKLFSLVFDHACTSLYDGWDNWRMDILYAAFPLCVNPVLREKLEAYLHTLQTKEQDDFSSQYTTRAAQKIIYGLIARFDGEAAAKAYSHNNLDNRDFRRIAVETAIAQNELVQALQLCLDGEQLDAGWAGRVSEWQHLRYSIYEKQNDIAAKRELAEHFLLRGEFDFYAPLKAMYAAEEWAGVYERLLDAMAHGACGYGAYVKILVLEKHQERLLRYCKENPQAISELYPHLVPLYKEELAPLFANFIRQQAKAANGRAHYCALCRLIKHYQKACGADGARSLKEELLAAYPRRRAMIEEIGEM